MVSFWIREEGVPIDRCGPAWNELRSIKFARDTFFRTIMQKLKLISFFLK